MNTKNVLGIAALIITVVFAMQMVQQVRVEAQQSSQTQAAQAIEYATLEFEDEDTVTWRLGGVVNVRTESIRATYRRLGGQDRGTLADLLDQIGSEGWNLVLIEGDSWIFSRNAS